jgi:hypothetical protein
MSSAVVEFLLTDRPIKVEIEFEEGSMLEGLLPILEERFFSSIGKGRKDFEEALFSSVIITQNGMISGPKTPLKQGSRIRIFHLLDGG